MEDLANLELQNNEPEPHDPDNEKSSTKKVIISGVPLKWDYTEFRPHALEKSLIFWLPSAFFL